MANTESRKASAPYGQACTHCVKAKCRCLPHGAGTICERCHRLGKVCVPSTTVRRRGAKRTTASKTSELENKLDDIVSILRATAAADPAGSSTPAIGSLTCLKDRPGPYTSGPYTPESSGHQLQERDLVLFRERYLQFFPLLELPQEMTAVQLQQDKPMLCLAILVLSAKGHAKQVLLSKDLREILARKISAEGERSMDLLQSVLVCIAWSLYTTHRKYFLGTMIGLAKSMVSDLRLDRTPLSSNSVLQPPHLVGVVETAGQTDEGRRACIACFTLSVIVSASLKHDPMRWSPQLEDACSILSAAGRSEDDKVLVVLTRLARILLDTSETAVQVYDDPMLHMQASLAIRPLKSSLDLLKTTFTEAQLRHNTIVVYMHCTEAAIFELALVQPVSFLSPGLLNHDQLRIQHLTSCLQACKACIDFFLSTSLINITTSSMLAFSYCLRIPYRIFTMQDSGLDQALVRSMLDPAECLERAADEADKANTVLKLETGEDSALKDAAEMMRAFLPQWRVPTVSVDDPCASSSAADTLMDFPDDFWLEGMINL